MCYCKRKIYFAVNLYSDDVVVDVITIRENRNFLLRLFVKVWVVIDLISLIKLIGLRLNNIILYTCIDIIQIRHTNTNYHPNLVVSKASRASTFMKVVHPLGSQPVLGRAVFYLVGLHMYIFVLFCFLLNSIVVHTVVVFV
jgi:hypothetical protein